MTVESIPIARLALAFVPVAIVILIMWRWQLRYGQALYAVARMLLQLLLIGFVLVFIFDAGSALIVLSVLAVMMAASSWIALSPVRAERASLYLPSLLSICIGGGLTYLLITQGVLDLDPWFRPSYAIPLAGMIFAAGMNSIAIAVERLGAELAAAKTPVEARATAFSAAMIPNINSLFAVGLVSLPGMMTGQILSGVSPFVAARYQIMVMCMIFGAAGISTAMFLLLTRTAAVFARP